MKIPVKDFVCKWKKNKKQKTKQKQSLTDILQNRDFSTGGFLVKFANFLGSSFLQNTTGGCFLKKSQKTEDLFTFTEEIFNEKYQFLGSSNRLRQFVKF